MPNQYGGDTDTEWAIGAPLDRINTITSARFAVRFLRQEIERLQNENRRLRDQLKESTPQEPTP